MYSDTRLGRGCKVCPDRVKVSRKVCYESLLDKRDRYKDEPQGRIVHGQVGFLD